MSRRLRTAVLAGGLAVVLLVALAVVLLGGGGDGGDGGAGGTARPEPGPGSSAPEVPISPSPTAPATGTLVGAWVKPERPAMLRADFEAYEAAVGRRLDIAHDFKPFDELFPTPAQIGLAEGRTLMISWNGAETSSVISGVHDPLIRQRAQALKDFNRPVLLRYFWEMDRPDQAAKVGSPAAYIAAWRHVRDVFAEVGAANVAWVWCPTAQGFGGEGRAQRYYPGDDSVDWICADGYNFAPTRPNATYRSFEEIMRPFYTWASSHPRPLMVGEFGVLEREPGERARWFTEARETVKTRMTRIKALVYFDSVRLEEEEGLTFAWSLRGSPDALASFSALARDEHFNPLRR